MGTTACHNDIVGHFKVLLSQLLPKGHSIGYVGCLAEEGAIVSKLLVENFANIEIVPLPTCFANQHRS